MYGHLERFSDLSDKYTVRQYVKEKAGEEILIPMVGIYDRFQDIDLGRLPDSFVMKATHGSAWNIIVEDKTAVDWHAAGKKISQWIRSSYYRKSGEANYRPLKGRILIETYLEDPCGDLKDYKFFCFGGEPKFVEVH